MANELTNKVVLGDETLIDLTSDTVTPQTMLYGTTAHDRSGAQITGAVVVASIDDQMSNSSENPVQNKVITAALGGKVDTVSGKGLSTEDYTTAEQTKLAGIASGAEVNQNAFSNVKVGSSTIEADGKTDTLELYAGSNITLTADTTNDKVTIEATDTTYSAATTQASGLMSSSDKTKLDATPNFTASTTDLTAGTSPLTTGDIYLVYEA